MGSANSLHVSAYYSEYNERFDLNLRQLWNNLMQALFYSIDLLLIEFNVYL